MSNGTAAPRGANPKSQPKVEIVYRNRKIHWIIKAAGYISITYLAFVLVGVFTGNWLGVDSIYPEFKLVAGTLSVVAVVVNIITLMLVDSITSGEGFE